MKTKYYQTILKKSLKLDFILFSLLILSYHALAKFDSPGCTVSGNFTFEEYLPLAIGPVSIIPAQCNSSSDGSIQVIVSGGVSPYTYLWNDGQTTGTAINLSAGIFTVTVTDADLNTSVGSWLVTSPSGISIASSVTNLLCNGQSTGKIDITAGGGTPGYSYNWNVLGYQGQGTPDIKNLAFGAYTVTITDNNLCSKIQNWLVTQPVALSSNGNVTNVTCFGGNNGTASLSGLGGSSPYIYKWSNGSTAQQITGLTPGTYNVTVTDANNCFNFSFLRITQPSNITITGSTMNATCQGCNNGQITTTISGGTGGNTSYIWNNNQTGSAAINLSAGTYTVTVTNAAGCTKSKSFAITDNQPFTFGAVSVIPVQCNNSNDGSVQLSVIGGMSPYTYLWNNGQTSGTAVNLSSGTYSVTVTDAVFSTIFGTWQVTSPSGMSIASTVTNLLCNGQSTGKIDITVSGGTPGYAYNWNVLGYQGQGTPDIKYLPFGTYTVTITDNNLCSKIKSWLITQPVALSSNGIVTNVTCFGGNNGTASLSGLGGTSPYTYKWSNGSTTQQITGLTPGNYNVTVTDVNNCFNFSFLHITQPSDITITGSTVNATCQGCNNGQITTTVSGGSGGNTTYFWNNYQTGTTAVNLSAGSYTVTVTNAAGCTKSLSFTVTENSPFIIGAVTIVPVLCNNSNDGSVQLSVSGGISPYTYLWNNGQTAGTAVNLSAGTYTVTVTDAVLSTNSGTWQVTSPPGMSIASTVTNLLCNGQPTGKIDITASGGTPGYAYDWNVLGYQGQGTPNIKNLPFGAYTVTITDNNLCLKIQSWLVTQPVALSSNGIVTNVTCFGGNNGTATLSGLGGTSPYTYKWSNGSTSQQITGLTPGTYNVTVSDANNCVNYSFLHITQPSDITVLGTPVNVTCQGCNNGQITTTIIGGSGGIPNYQWNNGQSDPIAINLTAGVYTVTVTNAQGCYKIMSFTVSEELALTIGQAVVTPPLCNSSSDGSIQLSVSGGTSPYAYLWSDGQTTETAVNLSAGSYSVTITDALLAKRSGTWQITSPSGISITSFITNLLCNGQSNGKIDITANGGTPLYSYNWNVLGYQGQGTSHVKNLPAGTYTVTVTDNNLCSKVQSWITIQPVPLSGNGVVTQVTCYGGNNGTASLSGLGGTSPYLYKWSNGSTSQQITGLTQGTYAVTVTDANGCVNFSLLHINQPSEITINGTPIPVTCESCSNGQIITVVSGGSGGTTSYLWNNGQTGPNAINLPVGNYTVTVTNEAGCSKSKSFTIIENLALAIESVTMVHAHCYNSNDGSIQLLVGGGTSPYTYLWNNGQTTGTAVNLSAGSYSVTVSDVSSSTVVGNWQITEPLPISISAIPVNVRCSGQTNGRIDLTVTGGTPGYSYNWNVLTNQGQGTPHVTGLAAGTYIVTVTDSHLCTKIQSWMITEPTALSGNGFVTNVTCYGGNNGTALISGFGGTAPYSYQWNTGSTNQQISGLVTSTYTVTITDANNCVSNSIQNITQPTDIVIIGTIVNVVCQGSSTGQITTTVSGGSGGVATYLWNNGQTGSSAINLTSGTYTITVTNEAGCVKSQSFTVTGNPAITFSSVVVTSPQCFNSSNGSVHIIVSGGISPYTYLWNNGQTSETASNLSGGIYTVTVTDAGPCGKVGSWIINNPSAMTITGVTTNLLCNGQSNGKVDITVNGGSPGYFYNWNILGYQGQGTPHISALASGTYTVTVTDNQLCAKIQSWVITEPTGLSGNGIVSNVTCYGGNNGTALISGLGGTPPYSYKWNTGSTTQLITGLSSSRYYVTITDANNCVNHTWKDIAEPSEITITGTPVIVTCNGGGDGQIITEVQGGKAGYSYRWSNNQVTPNAVNLTAGTYTVTVTDENTCWKARMFEVVENTAITITRTDWKNPGCSTSSDGYITVSATGGSGTYQFNWSNPGGTNPSISGLAAGTYTVSVTDMNNCIKTASWTLAAPPAMTLTPSQTNVLCYGQDNGQLAVSVAGFTEPYSYHWSANVASQQRLLSYITGLTAGEYGVLVTDSHSCIAIGIYTITQPATLMGSGVATNPKCFGGSDGSAIISGNGGTSPYEYSWNNEKHTQLITGLTAGRYYVTITDANNCSKVSWLDIVSPSEISINSTVTDINCAGSYGQISTSVSGGSGGPTTYIWSNGQTGPTAVNLTAGTYTVTVTNSAGCTASSNPIYVNILNTPMGTAGTVSGPSVVGFGQKGVVYAVDPINNATGYVWTLPPGGTIVSGENTNRITVDFSTSATSGNISVYGTNVCGRSESSDDQFISVIQLNLILVNNTTLSDAHCYDAIQTITVAGESSTFTVNSSGVATMIAGYSIVYKTGTTVVLGGYMHGYITVNEQYCTMPVNPVVNTPVQMGDVLTTVSESVKNQKVRIYPNPTTGLFTLELTEVTGSGMTSVEIYTMNGEKVISENLAGDHKRILSVENLRPGIYFIHVNSETISESMKLIKL